MAAGRRPRTGTTASTRRSRDSNYHGLHVSFVQRPTHWASVRVTYTLSKSMNDVGEAFFSSPIDPDRHHAGLGPLGRRSAASSRVNGTVNTSMAPATTAWERISHGFQVSGMLQYYSALPFNITSGVANLQGTTSRPLADGATAAAELRRAVGRVHSAQRRHGQRLLRAEPSRSAARSGSAAASRSRAWSKRST